MRERVAVGGRRWVGVSVLTVTIWAWPAVANAQTPVVAPGQALEVSSPQVPLVTPHDGRLRGYGYSASIEGIAKVRSLGDGSARAGRGQVLWVAKVSVTFSDVATPTSQGASVPGFDAAFEVGGQSIAIPTEDLRAGAGTWVVAAPEQTPVSLQMSDAGYSQAYSLDQDRRLPPSPVASYRDPASSTVAITPSTTAQLQMTDPATGVSAPVTVTLRRAELTFYDPAGPLRHGGDTNEAFLSVALEAAPGITPGAVSFDSFATLAASDIHLVLPGGATPTGEALGSGSSLFAPTYVFSVPANLTTASLEIGPSSVSASEVQPNGAGSPAVVSLAPTTLPLTFPVVPAPSSPGPAIAPVSTGGPSSANQTPGSGVTLWPWLAGLAAAILIVATTLVLWRRRQSGRSRRITVTLSRVARPALISPPRALERANDAAPPTRFGSTVIDVTTRDTSDPGPTRVGEAVPEARSTRSSAAVVEVRVLGPVEIEGFRRRPRRRIETELCCYLALHPGRSYGADELGAAVRPEEGPSRKSLWAYLSHLRRDLPNGVLAQASETSGYRLGDEVVTDWGLFFERSKQIEVAGKEASDGSFAAALGLVRGVPFSGVPDGTFAWAFSELLADRMEVAIETLAHTWVTLARARGDQVVAEQAARAGLVGVPASVLLHGDRLAATKDDPTAAARCLRDARVALGQDVVDELLADITTTP